MNAQPMAEIRERYERAAEAPMGRLVEGALVLAGLYLVVSPWLFGEAHTVNGLLTGLAVSNVVGGLAVAALGAAFATAYATTHRIAWTMPVLGAWAIVSVWLVAGPAASATLLLSNVVAGAVILLCGLAILRPAVGALR